MPDGFTIQGRLLPSDKTRFGEKSASTCNILRLVSLEYRAAQAEAVTKAIVTAKFAPKLRMNRKDHGFRRNPDNHVASPKV